ncbi:ATP synthase regulation protein NCA2 [Piedraia hortae CBS 480.64]|uniref:ATP synthase regulation protein NCA2 n=1 Tax=Piedraia hortae CBS 480.64 TaxID=1314780 RepID=A0A6A7BZK9_9PEZI|nr:ATP synthase regulation protein NCA2 [Piedraia hortae CBS 480.64]
MSFVHDVVHRIDAQLDHLQLVTAVADSVSPQTLALQAAIRGLTTSDSRSLVRRGQVLSCLESIPQVSEEHSTPSEDQAYVEEAYRSDLEWLLIFKATAQIYGHVLKTILDQAIDISNDIEYWDQTLNSRTSCALYGVQILPLHVWDIWEQASCSLNIRHIGQSLRNGATQPLRDRWTEFYRLAREAVSERNLQKQILGPITRLRRGIRLKQSALKKARLRNANALGVLLGEGLAKENAHKDDETNIESQQQWRGSVARNVVLMEAVLNKAVDTQTPLDNFDASVADQTDTDPVFDSVDEPQVLAARLSDLLTQTLPNYVQSAKLESHAHGKPSRLIRYWLPVTIGTLSGSTILRILFNRRADLLQWVRDLGHTVIDFWQNWVVEPLRHVIQTIRHDEAGEVSLLSKRSLQGDQESLERMVVDFAIDNPFSATGRNKPLTTAEVNEIRTRVREGDVTPVLKAYEQDLASPFMSAVRGNLVRALLIQIQKTKVDIDVAMGGIDSLLKSQELVFGVAGLTPGILATYFTLQYFLSTLSKKRYLRSSRRQGGMLRLLRNIDRIITNATPTEYGELPYRDLGQLICEVHALRQAAHYVMPPRVFADLAVDTDQLCDVRMGVARQVTIAKRIRWGYAYYFS